jgi:hypothetical protein
MTTYLCRQAPEAAIYFASLLTKGETLCVSFSLCLHHRKTLSKKIGGHLGLKCIKMKFLSQAIL